VRSVTRLRRILVGAGVIVGGYIFTYLVNGLFGGYDPFYTSDGRRGYTGSLLSHDCIMWQPRFGSYYNKSRHDGIGLFFYPLLRLDQRLVHKTHCVWDDGFDSWSASLSEGDIHPKHREAYRRARESRSAPNHRNQRTPRSCSARISRRWRGAAAAERSAR
jgi:hypothetical protein